MAERIADVRRKLHEALDALAQRDELIERLRDDLAVSGRRLAEEVARRRRAEVQRVEAEESLVRYQEEAERTPPGRAGVAFFVRRAGADLARAARLVLSGLWHRIPTQHFRSGGGCGSYTTRNLHQNRGEGGG